MLINENRTIAHLDLDTFFVSVERLMDDNLKGKPIIVGGTSGRGVVSACSYEARQFGVHSAMPMRTAMQLCKEAIIIRGDMEAYSRYSRLVTEIIAESAPVFEKSSIDEHFLDITGMDRFFGSLKWMHELRQRIILESGLPISFGLSINKTVSKIATGEAKPNGELQIEHKNINPFLDPLSIRKIPMLGKVAFQRLRLLGVPNIGKLRKIPPEMMQKVLGTNGLEILRKANGIDSTPVKPYSERKSISTERTFEHDTIDLVNIRDILTNMSVQLAYKLRKEGKMCACVTIKIRYANYDTHTLQQQISYTSFDHIIEPLAQQLFKRVYQRRIRIRLIGLKLSNLVGGVQQLDLFDDFPEMSNLYQAMDDIRKRFGKNAIRRGC